MTKQEQNQWLDVYLKQTYGADASFRPNQREAIQAILDGKRALVVQKTGWGKSLIYFLATCILRKQGKGFTIIISPLLALMNNQIESAKRVGLQAATINSTKKPEECEVIYEQLLQDDIDVLFISPERLANEDFVERVILKLRQSIGLLVVDEAHCISDWGHDFRPDYQRIVNIIRQLPPNIPLLATTATANDRVIEDIISQMGQNVHLQRGPLTRESLYIQVIPLKSKASRLAWLAENINGFQGSGIIYCLTKSDCEMVSQWLASQHIDAYAYTGKMNAEERLNLEQRFIKNQMKVLVATIAFGMGVDKPDISFVIHFQKPGNVVSYYQQIGRAGRSIQKAYAILLSGAEDDTITEYFIESAFPTFYEMDEVVKLLTSQGGLSQFQLLQNINISFSRLDKALKYLTIKGDIYKEKTIYYKSPSPWMPDFEHSKQITALRRTELEQMNTFVNLNSCYMHFVADALNDASAKPCGNCAVCAPDLKLTEETSASTTQKATRYLKSKYFSILPRKKWPNQESVDNRNKIGSDETFQEGLALSHYGDDGWGQIIKKGKYEDGVFAETLIAASADILKSRCAEWKIDYVTAIPSLRRPNLVRNFAIQLSEALGLPFADSLVKYDSPPQKTLQNSNMQFKNAFHSFEVSKVLDGNVLLVDDMVDSKWTLTVCAYKLIKAGARAVYPFALSNTAQSGAKGD